MSLFPDKTTRVHVANRVLSMDTDYFECIYDILEEPKVLALENCQHHHKTNRLEHCLNVSYRSYKIAKFMGSDTRSTARGGLLHDFYDYGDDELEVDGTRRHLLDHPKLALKNALEIFELNEIEQDIIVKHMWGVTPEKPSFRESYIVTMMDKYCAIQEAMGFSPREDEVTRAMVARVMKASRMPII